MIAEVKYKNVERLKNDVNSDGGKERTKFVFNDSDLADQFLIMSE
jgi:hypothetical protein